MNSLAVLNSSGVVDKPANIITGKGEMMKRIAAITLIALVAMIMTVGAHPAKASRALNLEMKGVAISDTTEKNPPVSDSASTSKESTKLEEQKETYDAHRAYVKYHFDDAEMDFAFLLIIGSDTCGGCELGEAFYAAACMKDGDPQSWQDEWEKLARRVEARADDSLAAGHKVSARESYCRACNYYRAAVVSMQPDNPRFIPLTTKFRSLLKKAAPMFDPPLEYVEIPFEKTVLPGYFRRASNDGKKRKTLIMIGGGETYAEDNYFYIADSAFKRGYNFLTVDIPGQGNLPVEGYFFRYDTEVPLKAVVSYALSRPEVDGERLAMFGISNGGYFVPRAAQFDKRIKAVVVSAAVVDNYKMFKQMPFAQETQEEIDKWPPFKKCVTQSVAWRWGLEPTDIKGQVEKTRDFQFDPHKVACPFLDLIGEGEYANEETQRQQKECMDALLNPNKKFIVTPIDEGASSHCILDNRSLMSQIVFDWLDETFR